MGKTRKFKPFKKMNCFPTKKGKSRKNFTCYSNDALLKIRDGWNKRHPDVKIDTDVSRDIWENLKMLMADVCDSEMCWLRQQVVDSKAGTDLLNYSFAPNHPNSWLKNKNEWLSSIDIEKVMKQYEKLYPNFLFLGPSPIDFDNQQGDSCVWPEICNFSVKNMLHKNKNKIGFSFNTDPHYKSGAHWISMFLDLEKKFLYFFDSNGTPPSNEINNLTNRILNQCKEENMDVKYSDNTNYSHQKTNTECGMFSLYFIITLLNGEKSPEYFNTTKIQDNDMEDLRTKYFNS
tara:strand:- start:630 stop:1496 length:867 start_codon:yes stop_codon:yes gene_type:complete